MARVGQQSLYQHSLFADWRRLSPTGGSTEHSNAPRCSLKGEVHLGQQSDCWLSRRTLLHELDNVRLTVTSVSNDVSSCLWMLGHCPYKEPNKRMLTQWKQENEEALT